MIKISEIAARQVFDSRGIPTVEADVLLDGGGFGRFITPSGASVGKKEALELRDKDQSKFLGKGVLHAVSHIRQEIAQKIVNHPIEDQNMLDDILCALDGTENKSRLGANAILAVSGAFFHAVAHKKKIPLYRNGKTHEPFLLPLPLVNVINGGAHANNGLDIQEFMIVPNGAATFKEAMRMVAETFYALKAHLQAYGLSTAVGDEGGFAPQLKSNEHALDLLMMAVTKAGLIPGTDIKFALDVAASELYDEKNKHYRLNGRKITQTELLFWYENIIGHYPICSIEDPFYEEDFVGFAEMVKTLGHRVQIVGDDLFVTNEKYIRLGIQEHLANAVLIKMNQIGTMSETINAVDVAQSAGFRAIISHRSGDSEDTTIADLAVLMRAGQIKTGSLSRSERTAKYNRLLRIEEELGPLAQFAPWCKE
jgi:enolase